MHSGEAISLNGSWTEFLSASSSRALVLDASLKSWEMVAKALTNKEIGRAIQVSHFTVRNHVRHIIASGK